MPRNRIVIIGGVAGGASCAARCRRLDESAKISVIDRGPYVSFSANCGLPYYVGDVIKEESKLLVANAALFQERFLTLKSAPKRSARKSIELRRRLKRKEISTGRIYRERYDALLLAPAPQLHGPLPGVDSPESLVLRTIPDSRKIRAWISEKNAQSAVIVGAGFIGLK